MGKFVADYLNIKNENGVIKDLDGNNIVSKGVIQVVSKQITTYVSVTGSADVNVDLGDDYSITFNKIFDESKLLIRGCLHIYYGADNDASDVWSGGSAIISVNDEIKTLNANTYDFGLAHNSTTTDNTGRSMGYAISEILCDASSGDNTIKLMFKPCHAQQDDETNQISEYGVSFLTVMEVLQ